MSIKDEIKSYIVRSGWTMVDLAKELNKRQGKDLSRQNLSMKLSNETIRYKEVLQIAEILGYEIQWIPKNK